MTIHDVMKLDILRPTVGCGEWHGLARGELLRVHGDVENGGCPVELVVPTTCLTLVF